jgi:hypothetical protein
MRSRRVMERSVRRPIGLATRGAAVSVTSLCIIVQGRMAAELFWASVIVGVSLL